MVADHVFRVTMPCWGCLDRYLEWVSVWWPGNVSSTLYKPSAKVWEQESRLTTILPNPHLPLHLQHRITQQILYVPTQSALGIPAMVIAKDLGQEVRCEMQKADLKVLILAQLVPSLNTCIWLATLVRTGGLYLQETGKGIDQVVGASVEWWQLYSMLVSLDGPCGMSSTL